MAIVRDQLRPRVPPMGGLPSGVPWHPESLMSGGGPVFSPIDLSPTLWIDAQLSPLFQLSNGTTAAVADGDPVGYWGDLSGNGNHPIQATAGLRPLLQLAGNGINGLPCVLWDATDDYLRVTFGSPQSQPLTVYVGCSFGSTAAARMAFAGASGANDLKMYRKNDVNGYVWINAPTDVASTTAPSGVQMYGAVYSGASSTVRQNGVQILSGDPGANALGGVTVGANSNNALPVAGKIFALLVYAGAHTVAQQQQVETYYQGRGYWS